MDRNGNKVSVCCSNKRILMTLSKLYKSDLYKDAEDYREKFQRLLDENQADKSTKLRLRAKRHGFLPKEDLMKSSNALMNTVIAFAQLLSSRVQVFVN